jgi:hypothetical protein
VDVFIREKNIIALNASCFLLSYSARDLTSLRFITLKKDAGSVLFFGLNIKRLPFYGSLFFL